MADLGNEDEEEMKALRANPRYRGMPKKPEKKEEVHVPVRSVEPEPDLPTEEEELMQKFNLPTSFGGKKEKEKRSEEEISQSSKRRKIVGPSRTSSQSSAVSQPIPTPSVNQEKEDKKIWLVYQDLYKEMEKKMAKIPETNNNMKLMKMKKLLIFIRSLSHMK